MSKISIQGNASGTGTFTIASPNSNTDRTLVLPDEAGTVLTSASDIVAQAQASNPCFFATKSSDQTGLSDASDAVVTFDTERFDVGGIWNTSTNRVEVDASTAGYYYLSCSLFCNSSNSIENAYIMLKKNGTTYVETYSLATLSGGSASSTQAQVRFGTMIDLTTPGDYAQVVIYFDASSGGTTTVNQIDSTRSRTHISGHRVSV